MRRRVVIALGGNAFASPSQPLSMAGQFRFAEGALAALGPLLDPSWGLVLSHGNGPQVGHMLVRVEQSLGEAYALPLEVCVAESEGELGYVLLQSLYNVLLARGQPRPIASLLTQVIVDPADPAFQRPTKPIGPYYDDARAAHLRREGFVLREEPGRGHRRVVPSPRPQEIVDVEVVPRLLELGCSVIAAGGGGIPVVRKDGALHGIDAVIDKDHVAAMLADRVEAELLVILTGVPCVYRSFGRADQAPIAALDSVEARALVLDGHFAEGSMRPKVEAAAAFADRPGRTALICDPPSLVAALDGRAGTRVRWTGGT
ncbi:MAG: carbamate kinase [Deltaproteobacteria bacterium]|nr:carbamate kinase [Deltaproteobacteria bacterium]